MLGVAPTPSVGMAGFRDPGNPYRYRSYTSPESGYDLLTFSRAELCLILNRTRA